MKNSHAIADITPFTLLDYPGKAACIFWLGGCNLRCQYCYNVSLLHATPAQTDQNADYLSFLRERIGFLDGVVLSGGECTLYPRLLPLCHSIRELGFSIKVDTNGTRPEVIKQLLAEGLCDFIALDYKAPREQYGFITGKPELFTPFSETLDLLIASSIPFEVRTTVHPDLLTPGNINAIIHDLLQRGYKGTYFVQNFYQTNQTLQSLPTPEQAFDTTAIITTSIPVRFRNFQKPA